MRNKKGFTLVELIGVIALLAIIVTVSALAIINVRNNVLEKDYKNLKTYIETKAIEYANKTSITQVSVEDLIKEGFVKPDDETDIYNPIDNTSLNCYLISMEFSNGDYKIKGDWKNNLYSSKNTCKSYEKTGKYILKYEDESGNLYDLNNWIKKDRVYLVVKTSSLEDLDSVYTYEWVSSNGTVSTSKKLLIDATNKVVQGHYKVSVSNPNDVSDGGYASGEVKIDNEAPVVDYVGLSETGWTNSKVKVVVNAKDRGSGIEGIYVTDGKCSDLVMNNSSNRIENKLLGNGTYNICVKDKVGNVAKDTNDLKITVKKVDERKPNIEVITKPLIFPVSTNYKLLDNIKVTDNESKVKQIKSYVDGTEMANISTLTPGEYIVLYKAMDYAGNVESQEVKLTIFVPKVEYANVGDFEYEIPVDGTYIIKLCGAQGASRSNSIVGGKGAYLETEVYLHKGNVLNLRVGSQTQKDYIGGKSSYSGTYNGGGSTTVKLNGSYLARAGGGGGSSTNASGGAGGAGDGSGGASVGSGAGTAGTFSSGGSSSPKSTYSCNCVTTGGGCKSYETCCSGTWNLCMAGVCFDDDNDRAWGSSCVGLNGFGCVPLCTSYYPTYTNCDTCTKSGNPGNGGANYVASTVRKIKEVSGYQVGDGNASVEYKVG